MKYLFNMYTTWLLGFILIALKIWLYSTKKQFMKKIGYAQCLIHSLFFHFERIPHSTLYNMYIDLCEWQPEGTVSIFYQLNLGLYSLWMISNVFFHMTDETIWLYSIEKYFNKKEKWPCILLYSHVIVIFALGLNTIQYIIKLNIILMFVNIFNRTLFLNPLELKAPESLFDHSLSVRP